MPNFGMFPLPTTLLSGQTATTNGTSAALTLPLGQCYRLTVELLTATSTTTNLSVSFFSSDDNGTTYHGIGALSALTTSGTGRSLLVRPYLGIGDAATAANSPILGTTDYATNADVAVNGPFDPRYLKIRYLVASTGTVTFNVKATVVPQDQAD